VANQGIITFAGIRSMPFMQANVVLTHGVGPNVSTIQIPPQGGRLIEGGNLELTYGGRRITLHDCKVDSIDMERGSDGLEVWTLNILDRRWKWRMGEISGYYNVRRGEGIVQNTVKTARELAKLCLEAMGEERFDVAAVPNDQYPEVEWNYEVPAQALGKLCDEIGFRVILRLNNTVAVVKAGEGQRLPRGGAVLRDAATVDPPERPDSLVFVGDRNLWEWDLFLEAVAEEPDGRIVPLNEVSYAPRNEELWYDGFKWAGPDIDYQEDIDVAFQELAKRSVFRKYRILAGFRVPGASRNYWVDVLDQILPLDTSQLSEETITNEKRRREPVVWGIWSTEDDGDLNSNEVKNAAGIKFSADLTRNPEAAYQRGFRIDSATGIIEFNESVFRWHRNPRVIVGPGGGVPSATIDEDFRLPAELRLRIAFGVRNPQNNQWIHEEVRRNSPRKKFGTKPEYIKRADVQLKAIYNARRERWDLNLGEFEGAAKSYLDEHERRYEVDVPQGMTYVGLEAINLDGAIQQVSWTIDESGTTTKASRNREEPLVAPSYQERRLFQRTAEEVKRIDAARAEEERLRVRK
jgi:hypothetical protein